MLRWVEATTIFSVKRFMQVSDLHDILSAFEEEETSAMAMVYIEPNVGGITDEDSANEDDGGQVDHLVGFVMDCYHLRMNFFQNQTIRHTETEQ